MSAPLMIEREVHFERRGRGGEKLLVPGPEPVPAPPRMPRVAKLMALALRYDEMVRTGEVPDFATLARLGQVTRARMSQITSLLHVAPDIIEEILHLPPVEHGRDPIVLRDLLPIAAVVEWAKQRKMWRELLASRERLAEAHHS
jgi:hypothetical protein